MKRGLGWRSTAVALALSLFGGCTTVPAYPDTPLHRWLAASPMYVAHRGGDADWTEGTAYAYANAAAWNAHLALEVPVRRTSDGVWVVSEDATTARVFGVDHDIARTPWVTLAALRSLSGQHPMARLVNDVLAVYPRNRIIFVDDKPQTSVTAFLLILEAYGGPSRFVVKTTWDSTGLPARARSLGYLTWGYYYARDMQHFAGTQGKFDLLGLDYGAPAADFTLMRATGKPVIAHIIDSVQAAATALHAGATGLMVSAVREVVPTVAPGG